MAPALHAKADDAHRHDDGDRLPQRRHELADRAADDGRLIRHQDRRDAERQVGGDLVHGPLQIAAERQDVPAIAHGDGDADGRLAIHPEHGLRGIDVGPPDVGNIAQTDQAAVRSNVDRQNVQFGFECAGDAKRDPFVAGLQDAGGADGVLCLQRGDQVAAIDAQSCELVGGELDDDLFVLGADDIDFRHIGHAQQPCTDLLHIVAKLAVGETVGGEAVDDPEGIAELVVEPGPDDARRQGMADVPDALANVIPDVRDLIGGRAALQCHEDGGHTGAGEAAQEIEMRRFLELALDPLRHLVERVIEGRTRPCRLHDHRPEGECGILVAPEAVVRQQSHDYQREHAIHDERAVAERPFGKIESHHRADSSSRVFWPGWSA